MQRLRDKRRHHFAERRDLRREARDSRDTRVAEVLATSLAGPMTLVMRAEDQQRIERAFDRLLENQREVLSLFHLVGLLHREIAERLGVSVQNSRTILKRAVVAFAARWEELNLEGDKGSD